MRKHSLFIAGFQHKLNMYSPKTQRKRNHTKNTAVYNYIRAVFKKHKYNTTHDTSKLYYSPKGEIQTEISNFKFVEPHIHNLALGMLYCYRMYREQYRLTSQFS